MGFTIFIISKTGFFFFLGALTGTSNDCPIDDICLATPSPPSGISRLSSSPANPAATALSGSAIAFASAFLNLSSPRSSTNSLATFFLPTNPKLSSDLTPDFVSGLCADGFSIFIIGEGETAPPSANFRPEF